MVSARLKQYRNHMASAMKRGISMAMAAKTWVATHGYSKKPTGGNGIRRRRRTKRGGSLYGFRRGTVAW